MQRDRERAYFNLETQSYSSNAVERILSALIRVRNGTPGSILARMAVWIFGIETTIESIIAMIRWNTEGFVFSVADFTEEFKFSAEQAILAAEKAAEENEKYKVTRESNNESSVINLLQLLEPSSKSARELEERYTKLDVPQKKYCYIERS